MNVTTDPSGWVVSFEGKDYDECEEFIVQVKRVAFQSSRQKDDLWIAEFAEACLKGKALRWFEDLPAETQKSWRLLRGALLAQYPRDDVTIPSSASALQVVPAAAAPFADAMSVPAVRQGRVKLLAGSEIHYLSNTISKYLKATSDKSEALLVKLVALPHSAFGLELLNCSDPTFQWLGIRWSGPDPNVRSGSKSWAYLVTVGLTNNTSWTTNGPVGKTWSLLGDGTIKATWDVDRVVHGLDTGVSDDAPFVAADINRHLPADRTARLIFEEL